MHDLEELLHWAVDQGVVISGIKPQTIPGSGTGVIATRDIQTILVVPIKVVRSLKSIPKSILRKLPRRVSLHGLLTAYLALDKSNGFVTPNTAFPDFPSFQSSWPFMWPPELQKYLPQAAKGLLEKQQRNFQRDWTLTTKVFPNIEPDQYLHLWLLVNTRSFYYTTPSMERFPHDDRLALLPIADLFNHADVGIESAFSAEGYRFIADRGYCAGEEVYFSYGSHSNDFLFAEYGFVPTENRWDVVCLDDVILPSLSQEHKELLQDRGYLGKYMLVPEQGECFRTQVALRLSCCSRGQWERFVDSGADEQTVRQKARALLRQLLSSYLEIITTTLTDVAKSNAGQKRSRQMLTQRWKQMKAVVTKANQDLSTELTDNNKSI